MTKSLRLLAEGSVIKNLCFEKLRTRAKKGFALFFLFLPPMIKALQKIMLLVAVTTVIGHSIFPHIHHNEITFAREQHHHDGDSNSKHHHDDEEESNNKQHDLLSFAQLDDNYVPAKKPYCNFEAPIELIPLITALFIDNSTVATKTHFGWYQEYPPPNDHFRSSSLRGPPAV